MAARVLARTSAGFVAGLLLIGSHNAEALSLTFTDGTFNNADWSSIVTVNDAPASSITNGQVGTGGDPGPFRETEVTDFDIIVIAHLSSVLTFDPSTQFPISYITVSYDTNWTQKSGQAGNNWLGTTFVIRQGGVIYDGVPSSTALSFGTGWQGLTTMWLTESDFQDDVGLGGTGTLHPDFSASGGPIELGYSTSAGKFSLSSFTVGVDNFAVTVVPEPGTLVLVGLGFAGLAITIHRKQVEVYRGAPRAS